MQRISVSCCLSSTTPDSAYPGLLVWHALACACGIHGSTVARGNRIPATPRNASQGGAFPIGAKRRELLLGQRSRQRRASPSSMRWRIRGGGRVVTCHVTLDDAVIATVHCFQRPWIFSGFVARAKPDLSCTTRSPFSVVSALRKRSARRNDAESMQRVLRRVEYRRRCHHYQRRARCAHAYRPACFSHLCGDRRCQALLDGVTRCNSMRIHPTERP